MLYFLYGSDTKKSREKLHELLDVLQKKKPDASVFKMDAETWDAARFEEFIGGQGLFEHKYIVVLDHVFEQVDAKERIVDGAREIQESDNVFLCLEATVDKATLKKIEKYAQKVQEFEEKERVSAKPFNIFSLTDALGKRDKKQLWVLYQQALEAGSEPEEIHGILLWQIKSMLLATQSQSAEDAGLKPFVYQKASGFARNFSHEELRTMSARFVSFYHDARRGVVDLGIALERFLLTI